MVEYRRDTENLKRAIREHTVHGYPLVVPAFGDATAISTTTLRGFTSILVELNQPMPFRDYASKKGWTGAKLDREEWGDYAKQRRFKDADTAPLRWMHPKSQAVIEEGYRLSMQDIQETWLKELGHLQGMLITKFSFDLNSVYMDNSKLQPGMIVTFHDNSSDIDYPGRIIAVGKDPEDQTPIVYLEFFEPIPALKAPQATAESLIEPSFAPDRTWVLGYGTLQAMQKARVKIPSGMFDEAQRLYYLDQPIPLSKIEKICKKHYPDIPRCISQSMVFLVLPIHPFANSQNQHNGGNFKPFPDDVETTEIEAQIDYFGGSIEFEE